MNFERRIENKIAMEREYLIGVFKKLVESWVALGNGEETRLENVKNEQDARNMEVFAVGSLLRFLKENPAEKDNVELKFIVEEYLRIGDDADQMGIAAKAMGIKFYDPFKDAVREEGAIGPSFTAGRVLKEVAPGELDLTDNETDERLN